MDFSSNLSGIHPFFIFNRFPYQRSPPNHNLRSCSREGSNSDKLLPLALINSGRNVDHPANTVLVVGEDSSLVRDLIRTTGHASIRVENLHGCVPADLVRLQYTKACNNLYKVFWILKFKTALSALISIALDTVTNLVDIDGN